MPRKILTEYAHTWLSIIALVGWVLWALRTF